MTKQTNNENADRAAAQPTLPVSGIRDNCRRGKAGDFLRDKIMPDARLAVVSAYFTIYGFDALKDCLSRIEQPDFELVTWQVIKEGA